MAYLVMPDGEIVAVDGEIKHEEEIVAVEGMSM